MNNCQAVVTHLIKAKADLNAVDCSGLTALHLAAGCGHEAVVEQLLQAKADPTIVAKGGRTAAKLALVKGHAGLAKRLQAAVQGSP